MLAWSEGATHHPRVTNRQKEITNQLNIANPCRIGLSPTPYTGVHKEATKKAGSFDSPEK
jgi:hypothetical protein